MRRGQLAAICPTPGTPDELDAAADLVLAYPASSLVVRRFNRFDEESRICRSRPVMGGR